MRFESELALVIGFYLSKYDAVALSNLGYSSFKQAYEDIGARLDVKTASIKNMRDEFDPLHDNQRAGWYQRPLRPSRVRVVEAFGHMSEASLRSIVHDIIHSEAFRNSGALNRVVNAISENTDDGPISDGAYSTRGVTGKKAEELFWSWFHNNQTPWAGELHDHREFGQGYDYLLNASDGETVYIEVKGLASNTGGILLTDKEWRTAQVQGNRYVVVLVSGLDASPKLSVVPNPAATLSPNRHMTVSVVVNWSVPSAQLGL